MSVRYTLYEKVGLLNGKKEVQKKCCVAEFFSGKFLVYSVLQNLTAVIHSTFKQVH
jgi:hypothetical protein